jgi:hypothetical protein
MEHLLGCACKDKAPKCTKAPNVVCPYREDHCMFSYIGVVCPFEGV